MTNFQVHMFTKPIKYFSLLHWVAQHLLFLIRTAQKHEHSKWTLHKPLASEIQVAQFSYKWAILAGNTSQQTSLHIGTGCSECSIASHKGESSFQERHSRICSSICTTKQLWAPSRKASLKHSAKQSYMVKVLHHFSPQALLSTD